jgi:thiosulfate dehydrogenase
MALGLALGLAAPSLTQLPFAPSGALADEFTAEDLARWQAEYLSVVQRGRDLFTDTELGSNGVVCAQCHPNAANTHPETYPKFQKQLGRVAALWEMTNWCIRNPLQGKDLAADDPKMIALQAYMTHERRGVKLEPGKH